VTACGCEHCEHCGHEFDAEPEGGHGLLCGDSGSAEDTDRVWPTDGPMVSDPPYAIGENYGAFDDSPEALTALIERFLPIVRKRSVVVMVTCGVGNIHRYPWPTWVLAWVTPAGSGSGPWGFCCWQPVLAYGKDPFMKAGKGRHPDTLVKTESADNSFGHLCPKPVETWTWFLERADPSKSAVFIEPFTGSGTTLIAAEQTGRICLGLEIDPAYCDVAVKRWSKFTGRAAVLADDGRTFDELAANVSGDARRHPRTTWRRGAMRAPAVVE
jgi:hypothetical protein